MQNTPFDVRPGEFAGDMAVWLQDHAADNTEQLGRLKKNLHFARERELTVRQRQILEMYYEKSLTMSQIARELSLNRSTVSRTIARAKRRLYRCLRYGL